MTMSKGIGQVILTLSGAGFMLAQLAIARFGRRGAIVVEAVTVGLLARDAALLASSARQRLSPVPAGLLWAETAAALTAAVAGAALLRDPEVTDARERGWNVPRPELARRVALGVLFGLHTWRFRILLAPGSGLRDAGGPAAAADPSVASPAAAGD